MLRAVKFALKPKIEFSPLLSAGAMGLCITSFPGMSALTDAERGRLLWTIQNKKESLNKSPALA